MRKKVLVILVFIMGIAFMGCKTPIQLIMKSSAKEITSFSFASQAAQAVIDEANHTVSITVPDGTYLDYLSPVITHTGASISPASGKSSNFTAPVTYTVTAEDGTSQAYVVTVKVASKSSKEITSFKFTTPAASAAIDTVAHTISIGVPNGTDVSALVPTIVHTGASISPSSGVAEDFSNPAHYVVTAIDGSTQDYAVSVNFPPAAPVISPANDKTYQISVTVTISSDTEGGVIYYTTGGSDPTRSSNRYTAPFTINSSGWSSSITTTTIKAIVVKDGLSSDVTTLKYSLVPNVAPVAIAGRDIKPLVGSTVALNGAKSYDVNDTPLTYQWALTAAPVGSAASIANGTQVNASIVPDKTGPYTITLTVSDGVRSDMDTLVLFATYGYGYLGCNVVDAEYSSSLDAVVMITSAPSPELKVYHVATGAIDSVPLPYTPDVVAVNPEGNMAAVAYNGGNPDRSSHNYVSIINLTTVPELARTYMLDETLDTSNDTADIILTADHVYTLPQHDQWESIRVINIVNGLQTTTGGSIYASDGCMKYCPSRSAIYLCDGLSGHDRYNVPSSGNALEYERSLTGSGTNRKFWVSDDGTRCVNDLGEVLSISDTAADDMKLLGLLGGTKTDLGFTAGDVFLGGTKIAAIKKASSTSSTTAKLDTELLVYDALTYALDSSIALPTFAGSNADFVGHGCFVFHTAAGTRSVVIEKADATYSSAGECAIVVY